MRARVAQRCADADLEPSATSHVSIRLLSSFEKHLKVLPRMRERCGWPAEIPYTLKAFGAFMRVADSDDEVCFFYMFSQEYGVDCPAEANRRYGGDGKAENMRSTCFRAFELIKYSNSELNELDYTNFVEQSHML